MLIISTQPPVAQIRNEYVHVNYDLTKGTYGIANTKDTIRLDTASVSVKYSSQQVNSTDACLRKARVERGRDALGPFARLIVTHSELQSLTEFAWTATLRPKLPYAVIQVTVRSSDHPPGAIQSIEVLSITRKDGLHFGSAPGKWMIFTDSGGQGGTGVAPFFASAEAHHASPATVVVHDGTSYESLLVGWLSWIASNPYIQLSGTKTAGLTGVSAQCSYYSSNNATGETIATEPMLIGFESDPIVALELYAREVMERNHPPIRKDTVMGWLSWYCSRLTMTEQFVLANGKVISEQFLPYGIDTMQVDHGWEYRDIVGHWVANDRFPHGMKWLGDRLQKMGLKLGIWMAVGCVSEFAPLFEKHPDATIHTPDGQPRIYTEHWTWAPHGKVYNLDPTHPAAQQHYRKSLRGLMDAGCRYYKVDFIGSSGAVDGVFHDPNRPRGNPMARFEMQQIRDAVGAESWLRYCSSPSNVYCGIVNIGGATMDIGNAGGNWEHLQQYHQQLGSFWYKHRTFWHNEPDALIVGEGSENEARMRCAWLAMSGGVVALGDDLTKIAPERKALIPLCLPSYDVAARPLDLFEHIPARVWDLHVQTTTEDYHILTLFNFQEKKQEITVPLEPLGIRGPNCIAWEFWTKSSAPTRDGSISFLVPPRDCRLLAIRRLADHPQVVGTDMHLTMGAVELTNVKWDGRRRSLSGVARRAPGERGEVFVHVPEGWSVRSGASEPTDGIATINLDFKGSKVAWEVRFTKRG